MLRGSSLMLPEVRTASAQRRNSACRPPSEASRRRDTSSRDRTSMPATGEMRALTVDFAIFGGAACITCDRRKSIRDSEVSGGGALARKRNEKTARVRPQYLPFALSVAGAASEVEAPQSRPFDFAPSALRSGRTGCCRRMVMIRRRAIEAPAGKCSCISPIPAIHGPPEIAPEFPAYRPSMAKKKTAPFRAPLLCSFARCSVTAPLRAFYCAIMNDRRRRSLRTYTSP
jgi:hypothetical protein